MILLDKDLFKKEIEKEKESEANEDLVVKMELKEFVSIRKIGTEFVCDL